MAAKAIDRDPLGLLLDDENLTEIPPSIVIYGQPGSGKSTDIAKTFHDCLWVCSNSTVLRPYASWCRENPELAEKLKLRTPDMQDPSFPNDPLKRINRSWGQGGMARKTIPEFKGTVRVNNWSDIQTIIDTYVRSCEAGTCPYGGIVFDEWSTFAERISNEMKAHYGKDGFAMIREIKKFHKDVQTLPQRTGRKSALVCHDQPPKWEEKEGALNYGKFKYPGGPKLPIGTLIKQVCADADIVIQVELKKTMNGSVERRYATEVHPEWERKFRDFSIGSHENLDLMPLLLRAGYNLGTLTMAELAAIQGVEAEELSKPKPVSAGIDI